MFYGDLQVETVREIFDTEHAISEYVIYYLTISQVSFFGLTNKKSWLKEFQRVLDLL